MRKFKNNEVGIGFNDSATESEYKAAEHLIRSYFRTQMEFCFRDENWVVAEIAALSSVDCAGFCKFVAANSSQMPHMQACGPTS
jgi:hypothetical protein